MAESIVAAPIISQLDPYELPDGGELDEPSGASRSPTRGWSASASARARSMTCASSAAR
jgi:hypothetical protein